MYSLEELYMEPFSFVNKNDFGGEGNKSLEW
jgi:hypothetical protein